jgi:4-amino-4-deoxy-L-arabinose transferase-like glycosyltransferase
MGGIAPPSRLPEEIRLPRPISSSSSHQITKLQTTQLGISRYVHIKRHLPFVVVLIIACYFVTINISTPWQSIHEDNGTLNESIALNHLRFGLGVTKGQDLLDIEAKQSFGPVDVTEQQHFAYFLSDQVHQKVYGDHPPLLGLTIAGTFLIFGQHFWAERLVPILYSLAGLLVFYVLICQFFDREIATYSAFCYATFPMFDYFGRNVSHEAPTLFWSLLLLLGYFRWRTDRRTCWLVLMAASTVIAGLYGWPLYYFAFILWCIDWWAEKRPCWRLALVTLLPALITFILVIAQLAWILDGNLLQLSEMFAHRTGGGAESDSAISTIDWLNQIMQWNIEGFGQWTQLALPIALAFVINRFQRERWSPRLRMIAILGTWGLSHILIFRNGAYVHAYWQFYLLPFYAITLAWCGVTLARHYLPAVTSRRGILIFASILILSLGLPSTLALYRTGYHAVLPVTPLFDIWH